MLEDVINNSAGYPNSVHFGGSAVLARRGEGALHAARGRLDPADVGGRAGPPVRPRHSPHLWEIIYFPGRDTQSDDRPCSNGQRPDN